MTMQHDEEQAIRGPDAQRCDNRLREKVARKQGIPMQMEMTPSAIARSGLSFAGFYIGSTQKSA